LLTTIRHKVLQFIDFFHKPFAKWIDVNTFRYIACGGSNTVMDILIYFIAYNYILHKQDVYVAGFHMTAPIAAFFMSFTISFPSGFVLAKYIVFPESNLHGRVQLFRYAVLVSSCILLNYIFIKFFVEYCGMYATPSKICTAAIVAVYSYISQRHFTFKVKPAVTTVEDAVVD
jgi:putative flippase GtrA